MPYLATLRQQGVSCFNVAMDELVLMQLIHSDHDLLQNTGHLLLSKTSPFGVRGDSFALIERYMVQLGSFVHHLS